MRRDTESASHRDPVHDRHDRLRIGRDLFVDGVFAAPESHGVTGAVEKPLTDAPDVPSRAQATFSGPLNRHHGDAIVVGPFPQTHMERLDHGRCQRVDRLGAVQHHLTEYSLAGEHDLVGSGGTGFEHV